jgi:DNA modification methylase
MPSPYYNQNGITIYHGDCRNILPTLDRADLVLTDPPYGIGRDGKPPSTSTHGGHKGYDFKGWDQAPVDDATLRLVLAAGRDAIVFGANYYPQVLPPSPGWIVWDKGQRIDQADGELAFTTRLAPLRVFILNRVALQTDGAVHPTQKPEALILWCISLFPSARTVIDPFMGSGTTLAAAKRLGLTAIGIDIHQEYCDLAIRRLRQGALPFAVTA